MNDDIISKSYRKKISWATDTIGLQNSKNLNLKVYGDTLIVHNNLEIFYKTEMMQSWTKIKANFLICISKVVLYNNGLYVQNCDRIYRTENLGKPGIH